MARLRALFATAILLSTAIGLASMPSSQASSGTLDEAIHLPGFASGAHGLYLSDEGHKAVIHVAGESLLRDGQGAWHASWTVEWQGATTFLGPERVLAAKYAGAASSASITYVDPREEDRSVRAQAWVTHYGRDLRPCGVHGRPGPVSIPLLDARLPGTCPEGPAQGRLEGDLVVFRVKGEDAVAYRADTAFPAWLRQGERTWVLQATGEGGASSAVRVPATATLVPPATTQATRMGPSEEGSAFRPSFTQLFEAARDDLVNDRLRTYLRDNPGWYVARVEGALEGDVVRYSAFLNAPRQGLELQLDSADGPGAALRPAMDKATGWSARRVEALPFVPTPPSLPSAASVQGHWASAGQELLRWGYDTTCAAVCLGEPVVWAGDASPYEQQAFDGPEGQRHGLAVVGADGTPKARIDIEVIRASEARAPSQALRVPPAWGTPNVLLGVAPAWSDTAGLFALGLLVAAALWKGPALVGLFSRVEPSALLDHPVRRALADAVKAHPGLHLRALSRLARSGNGATEHHLRRLVAAGILHRRMEGGYACYYASGSIAGAAGEAGAAGMAGVAGVAGLGNLKAAGARRILEKLRAAPAASTTELAHLAGLDVTTAGHHVRRLEQAGLVTSSREGRTRRVAITGRGLHAMDRLV